MTNLSPHIRLFATDIEQTLMIDGESAVLFKQAWESIEAERRPLLVYNTGRSVAEAKWLMLEGSIPAAEFIIGAVGTEIFDPIDTAVAGDFTDHIGAGWAPAEVLRIVEAIPGVRRQSEEFLNACKLSWHWHRATRGDIAHLEVRLKEAGLDVSVLYTSDVFLDVIPSRAGKGNALAWLGARIGVDTGAMLVAGASGNNGSMFRLAGVRGILVGNASRELFGTATACRPFMASAASANGVLAGLRHFGVLTEASDMAVTQSAGGR